LWRRKIAHNSKVEKDLKSLSVAFVQRKEFETVQCVLKRSIWSSKLASKVTSLRSRRQLTRELKEIEESEKADRVSDRKRKYVLAESSKGKDV